jgi:hypothetical protein
MPSALVARAIKALVLTSAKPPIVNSSSAITISISV